MANNLNDMLSDKELQKLEQEIAEKQAKIEKNRVARIGIKSELLEALLGLENLNPSTKNDLKKAVATLPKTSQKYLKSIYEWLNDESKQAPNPTPATPAPTASNAPANNAPIPAPSAPTQESILPKPTPTIPPKNSP